MIRPLAQAGFIFFWFIFILFREYLYFLFFISGKRLRDYLYFLRIDSGLVFFFFFENHRLRTSCTEDTPGMGQWDRRPKADPDPAKSQPVCPGPNGRARTATAAWAGPHAGWSDDSELLRVIYRAVQLGRASPAHSSLRNSGSSALFFPPFFFKKTLDLIFSLFPFSLAVDH